VALAVMTAAGTANAGFTTVNTGNTFGGGLGATGGGGSELNIVKIMESIPGYGAYSAGAVGTTLTFTGGGSAKRVEDFGSGGVLTLVNGSAGALDQKWKDGTVTFEAHARFAGFGQAFGYNTALDNSTFATTVTQITGSGLGASGSGVFTIGAGDFQWMRADNLAGANRQFSIEANNAGACDQMVAWEIFGFAGQKRYLLAFEDIVGSGSDRDFNDLVMELVVVIPPPSAGGMGLAGLLVLGVRRRRSV